MSSPEETRAKLIIWGHGSAKGEYLASHILQIEDFRSIEPIHPQGGPDGTKDCLCYWANTKCVAACWFPNNSNEKNFGAAKAKFESDLVGVAKNSAEGFVFITNKELALAERIALEGLAASAGCTFSRVYHLETLRMLLDSPGGVGIRLLILGIPMSLEEQQSFVERMLLDQRTLLSKYEKLIEQHHLALERYLPKMTAALEETMKTTIERAMAVRGSLPVKETSVDAVAGGTTVEAKDTDDER
jgi:hypothetical protein